MADDEQSGGVICWIRRDLRTEDSAALERACEEGGPVFVVFVFDTNILDGLEDRADRRVTFIHRSVCEVARALEERGSRLVVLHGDPMIEIPQIARELGASLVVAAEDFDPYAIERDRQIAATLKEQGTRFELVLDHLAVHPREVVSREGTSYRVFSPYFRQWSQICTLERCAERVPRLDKLAPARLIKDPHDRIPTLSDLGFVEASLWLLPGERAANERLQTFLSHIDAYEQTRDRLQPWSTSGLSVHLRFGTLSIRACLRAALQRQSEGAKKWIAELAWREFYQMILWRWPHVVSEPFDSRFRDLKYPGDLGQLLAWKQGRTGFPIIDAAMRCLLRTGWMHNRLRMLCASFFTKDLLLDWRLGEAVFAAELLDFELASNNGGWQWSASVGADAQPYTRIFNPVIQSRKVDPRGDFIRAECPELSGFDDEAIHWPHAESDASWKSAGCRRGIDYPNPIVDHAVQRVQAIELLKRSP